MTGGGDYNQVVTPQRRRDAADAAGFVPDFCSAGAVLTVLLVSQLLAVMLCLAPDRPFDQFWTRLSVTAFFVLWVALLSVAVLCACRSYLARLSPVAASVSAFFLLETLVLGATLAAELLIRATPTLGFAAGSLLERLLRNGAIAGIANAVLLRYLYLQYSIRARMAAESQARLQALQARIRPHFLFNSLNTILSLIRDDPPAAEQATEGLADLFRASLREAGPLTTLAREIELCRSYLKIEQLRLGDRLQVDWSLDKLPDNLPIPPLVLQPLLENAIYHGVEQLDEAAVISLTGSLDGARAVLVVSNPLPDTAGSSRPGQRIALDNIRARLASHFGNTGHLTTATLDDRFIATVTLPVAGVSAE